MLQKYSKNKRKHTFNFLPYQFKGFKFKTDKILNLFPFAELFQNFEAVPCHFRWKHIR